MHAFTLECPSVTAQDVVEEETVGILRSQLRDLLPPHLEAVRIIKTGPGESSYLACTDSPDPWDALLFHGVIEGAMLHAFEVLESRLVREVLGFNLSLTGAPVLFAAV